MSTDRYVPALRFSALTRFYDPAIRWTTREERFKRLLLGQAALKTGQRALDLGCGTGTLAIMAKRAQPKAEVSAMDGDPEILGRARAKASTAGAEVQFDQGFSTELPYEDESLDMVLSTLFFHHLTSADKRRTAGEIARVLRPGGELHVADWGLPADALMRVLFSSVRVFDGLEQTRDNVAGALPKVFEAGGLEHVTETNRLRTAFGTLALYRARRPLLHSVGEQHR